MRVLAVVYCFPPLLVPAAICYMKLLMGLQRSGVEVEIVRGEHTSPETIARTAALAAAEQEYLRALLAHAGGDIPRACSVSGLSRSRLYCLLKKYRIAPPSSAKS